jgi:hypothetical protein
LLGTVPATPEPQVVELTRQSPIPEAEAQEFSDDDWLGAIRTYADDVADQASSWFKGGAYEVAAQLETAAKSQPGRFARLAGRIGPDANPAYVRAILRAISSSAQDLGADDQLAAIDVVRVISTWPGHDLNRELCDVIGGLAGIDLPDDILDLIIAIATKGSDQPTDLADVDGETLIVAGLIRDRGQAVYAMAWLLAPAVTRDSRAARLLTAARMLAAAPDETVRVLLPPVIVRIFLSDHAAATEIAELWLDHATDETLRALELDRLAWQLLTSGAASGSSLIERMVTSPIADVRTRGGALAALASVRRDSLRAGSDAIAPGVVLGRAMQDAASRKGVAQLLAQLVDQLPAASGHEAANGVVADRELLIRLLDDDDHDVRESAVRYTFDLTAPLSRHSELFAATARSLAFREHPAPMLHALHRLPSDIPQEALDLCEEWLRNKAEDAGDIRNAAAGDAYYVVDIVFSIHSGATVGSPVVERCLALIDRLVEIGAFDVEKKIEAAVLT